MAGVGPCRRARQFGGQVEPELVAGGEFGRGRVEHLGRHRDGRRLAGRHHAGGEPTGRLDDAVARQGPAEPQPGGRCRVVPVLDQDRRVRDRQADRGDDGRELGEPGRRGVVGQHQAVHHEVAVVHDLAEVAAVGVVVLAGGSRREQTVVPPLPHEPAVQARVPVDQGLVLGDLPGAVAHGVHVLAVDERLRALPCRLGRAAAEQGRRGAAADGLGLLQRRVHPRVHVGVLARVVALVVHGALGVAVVHPLRHRGEVPAGAGLVAERPHHDGRVVLVPLDGACDAVEVGLGPVRVVGGVADPAGEDEPVGLEVGLEDHPEAELVGQVEHAGVRRVVRGPDRVDVVALHERHVRAGVLLVEDAAAHGVGLVPVHAVEHHALAVDQEPVALDRHGAEAEPQRDGLAAGGTAGVGAGRHRRVVELRQFRAPRLDALDRRSG